MDAYDFKDPLNLIAATFMLINGVFGVVFNVLIIYIFVRSPSERTSFTLICVFRGIGNSAILLWGFLATFVPITLSGTSPFPPYYEALVILSVNNIYTLVQYSGVIIAVNRFCAMFFPMIYTKYFNMKLTIIIMTILTVWRATSNILYIWEFFPLSCYVFFSSTNLAWLMNPNKACYTSISSPLNSTAIYVSFLIFLNMATFAKIYFFYKSTEIEESELRKKAKNNKILFLQTVFQDAIMLVDMLFTFKLSALSDERYWTFISGSLVWQCVHSSDGLIMVMFNERLTLLKKTLFSSASSSGVNQSKLFVSRH